MSSFFTQPTACPSLFASSSASSVIICTSPSLVGASETSTVDDSAAESDGGGPSAATASPTAFYVANDGDNNSSNKNRHQQTQRQQQQNANKMRVPKKTENKDKFKCSNCGTKLKSQEMLCLHRTNSCSAARSFASSPTEQKQQQRHQLQQSTVCDLCQRSFYSPRGVLIHKCRMHKVTTPTYRRHSTTGATAVPSLVGQRQQTPTSSIGHDRVHISKLRQCHANAIRQNGETANAGYGNAIMGVQQQQQHGNGNIGWENNDDDIMVVEVKHRIVPRNNNNTPPGVVGPPVVDAPPLPSSAMPSPYAAMVIGACAQSNLVTFHDVDTAHGTIGKITFQFMCNGCRGQRGVARCYRGRAYCVMCCGHPECD